MYEHFSLLIGSGNKLFVDPDDIATIGYSDLEQDHNREYVLDNTCQQCLIARRPEVANSLEEA